MRKGLLLIMGLTASMKIGAADTVDVYGANEIEAQKIIKNYSKQIAKSEPIIVKEVMQLRPTDEISKTLEKNIYKRDALQKEIAKKYGYLFVEFQTVFYPEHDRYFTTIEIIDKQHKARMHFVNAVLPDSHSEKSSPHKQDLVDVMQEYNTMGMKMIINHQLSEPKSCPVYHCVSGFEHPKLKGYLAKFNHGVIKDKKLIIETLKHDSDPDRRASAAFLVGHFSDPHEIISVLTPSVTDRDDGVRNNVMRVIGTTIAKAKITNIDVIPFLRVLDSPYTTDRNKALIVLESAANSIKNQKIILQKGAEKLVTLMQLKQPNNHDLAYEILKKTSGKDFGSTNITAWRSWFNERQTKHQFG